ncbi:unnamed protein product, partial [Ixodes persulcatus]
LRRVQISLTFRNSLKTNPELHDRGSKVPRFVESAQRSPNSEVCRSGQSALWVQKLFSIPNLFLFSGPLDFQTRFPPSPLTLITRALSCRMEDVPTSANLSKLVNTLIDNETRRPTFCV